MLLDQIKPIILKHSDYTRPTLNCILLVLKYSILSYLMFRSFGDLGFIEAIVCPLGSTVVYHLFGLYLSSHSGPDDLGINKHDMGFLM